MALTIHRDLDALVLEHARPSDAHELTALIGIEGQVRAMESASAVSILNNDMGLTYAACGIPVADVASAFQSDDFVTLVPVSLPPPNDILAIDVSVICLLTYMCEPDPVGSNIHANPVGYAAIAATKYRVNQYN